MITARSSLLATGIAFGLFEAVDAFFIDVPGFAVLFAGLFFTCAAWFWRRSSVRAAVGLLLLFVFEIAEAPTWKAATATRAGAAALAAAGITAAVCAVVTQRRKARVLAA
jgi:hypothetical protein